MESPRGQRRRPPSRARKWIAGIALALGAAILLVGAIGSMLPESHVASIRTELPVPPDSVWAVLSHPERYPEWRRGVTGARSITGSGKWTGWEEEGWGGKTTFRVVEAVPGERLVARLSEPGFGGTWTYTLEPTARGTRVSITEHGRVVNPFFRVISHYVTGHHATLAGYREDLARAVGAE